MPYTVSTPVFEGPFDLLLHLITKQQVDLWEVSLASIVDQYVATLEELRVGLDLEVATEFLLIAAVLLELKAHRLLPQPRDVDPEEELALWEERDLLLARLLECKTFKDAAAALNRLMDGAGRSWPRPGLLEEPFASLAPDPLAGVTAETLRDALARAMAPKPAPRVVVDHIHRVRVTVAQAVAQLVDELSDAGRVSFAELTAGVGDRVEVIVRFLALLELYKRGLVDLEQVVTFGDLTVSWTGGEDPDPELVDVEEYRG